VKRVVDADRVDWLIDAPITARPGAKLSQNRPSKARNAIGCRFAGTNRSAIRARLFESSGVVARLLYPAPATEGRLKK
jgi:hypothetical protein